MRGIRGATTVETNTKEAIWQRAQEMLTVMMKENAIIPADIEAAIFSATEDLTAAFPTAGVRQLDGFDAVPLFDARQSAVEGSLPLCVRVLLFVDTDRPKNEIRHIYLHGAKVLRPDLAKSCV